MKKFLTAIIITLLIPFANYDIKASDNYLDSLEIYAHLNEDGSAEIREVWTGYFNDSTENYKILDNMDGRYITSFSVSDDSGNYYDYTDEWDIDASREAKTNKCGIIKRDDHYELCFGIGEYGYRTYTMNYTIDNFINKYQDGEGISWRFADYDFNINKISVHIEASSFSFDDSTSDIWGYGYEGTCNFNSGSIIMKTDGDIDYVQLVAIFPLNSFEQGKYIDMSTEEVEEQAINGSDFGYNKNNSNKKEVIIIFSSIITISASIFLLVGFILSKASMKKPISDSINTIRLKHGIYKPDKANISYFRDLPTDDIFYFYYLCVKSGLVKNNGDFLSAILLKWIRDNQVTFTNEGKAYKVDFSKDIDSDNEMETHLYHIFVAACGKDKILSENEFNNYAADNAKDLMNSFDTILNYYDNLLIKEKHAYQRIYAKRIIFNYFRKEIIYDDILSYRI